MVHAIEDENTIVLVSLKYDSTRLATVEELKEIDLVPGDSMRVLRIGSEVEPNLEQELSNFLILNTYSIGMPKTWRAYHPRRRSIISTWTPTSSQLSRRFGPERNKLIKAEVDKLLAAGLIYDLSSTPSDFQMLSW